jgi:hypothetical protein
VATVIDFSTFRASIAFSHDISHVLVMQQLYELNRLSIYAAFHCLATLERFFAEPLLKISVKFCQRRWVSYIANLQPNHLFVLFLLVPTMLQILLHRFLGSLFRITFSTVNTIVRSVQYRRHIVPLFAICLCTMLSSSCTTVRLHHIGRMYSPVNVIDVVYAEKDIKAQNYESMGEILLETNNTLINREMEEYLIEEAKLRGANAVILGETDSKFASPSEPSTIIRTVRARLVRYL